MNQNYNGTLTHAPHRLALAGLILFLCTLTAHAAATLSPKEHFDIAASIVQSKDEPRDLDLAMEHLRAAAGKNYRSAQRLLGVLHLDRFDASGKPEDAELALHWLTLGAEAGDAMAQDLLGSMYERGAGSPQDFARAVE